MIQKIRKEIERLKKEYSYGSSSEAKYRCEAYSELLSFLDTLQEPEVDLSEETEKQYNARSSHDNLVHLTKSGFEWFAKHFYNLDKQSSDNAHKIKGWAARDKDGMLRFHKTKPRRSFSMWISPKASMDMEDFFPVEVSWEDEPIEAELTIKKV